MKHSDFKIGDAVVRRWNNNVYYICHDIDNDKWEFLIDKVKGQKVLQCKISECYSNMRLATDKEINVGYVEGF